MNDSNNLIKKPDISTFLKIWQIIELVGLLSAIPLFFVFGILFTGDSPVTYNFVNSYILPSTGLFLVIKIIVAAALFKAKQWALYFNLIQSLILYLLLLAVIIITILAGAFSVIQLLFLIFFLLISRENLKCLRRLKN
ncbi:MAG: hypothetical protein GXP56_05910 [Deltaproteobacteria bacterium]|nr:hypothetical protein [Deltaproteobacteria bacterium]